MADNYWYSSLSSDEIEAILLNSVRGDVAQEKSTSWMAQARANIGAGAENTGFVILGYYDTIEELQESLQIPPKAGDAYGIGMAPPYHIYVWDASNSLWVDNGPLNIAEFIDDTEVSPVLTWSSEKINEELSQIDLSALIDDSDTASDTTWSSQKISSELSGKATPADVAALVDDSTTSASTTWSSQKIAAEIDALKWKLVWTNPAPDASFAAQTLSIDLSGCSWVKILFRREPTNVLISDIVEAPIDGSTQFMAFGQTDMNGHLGRRIVDYASASEIKFQAGNVYNSYGSAATSSTAIFIPYQIYAR